MRTICYLSEVLRQRIQYTIEMISTGVTANGQPVTAQLPCTIEEFLNAQGLLPRSVVVEHNGEAVAPSEFSQRQLSAPGV